MAARLVALLLIGLLVAFHAQLWIGRGNLREIAQLQEQLAARQAANAALATSNAQLAAEVEDLKTGMQMVEEKARMELGMLKPDEIFVHYARR